jgi:hypothetical protein
MQIEVFAADLGPILFGLLISVEFLRCAFPQIATSGKTADAQLSIKSCKHNALMDGYMKPISLAFICIVQTQQKLS